VSRTTIVMEVVASGSDRGTFADYEIDESLNEDEVDDDESKPSIEISSMRSSSSEPGAGKTRASQLSGEAKIDNFLTV
jgi:hypothetical protein